MDIRPGDMEVVYPCRMDVVHLQGLLQSLLRWTRSHKRSLPLQVPAPVYQTAPPYLHCECLKTTLTHVFSWFIAPIMLSGEMLVGLPDARLNEQVGAQRGPVW